MVSAIMLVCFGAAASSAQPGPEQSDVAVPVAPPAAPASVVTTEQKVEPIPFVEETREDGALPKGETKVAQEGVNGERIITFEITTKNGVEVSRKETKSEVTKAPVAKVTHVGTYVAPVVQAPARACDANYSGACVPIASDVDCAGGSGNGPAYVAGPVYVVGYDIYDLDRDGDGMGCE